MQNITCNINNKSLKCLGIDYITLSTCLLHSRGLIMIITGYY